MSIKYYISTYSAHASLLAKLAGNKQCEIKKLCVSYGGLKVPKGSFNECNWKPIFKNLFESKQVLHAKVILKQDTHNNELWLWTGNLRSCTKKSQNILISLTISSALAGNIKSWFNEGPNKHLVLTKSKTSKITAKSFAGAMVNILSKRIKKLDENDCDETYIFSPWGSSEVLEKLLKCNQVKNVNIYTRFTLGKMWLDYNSKKIISRNIADEKAEFPHSKCMFITNAKGKIIWAYIGSANFTTQAMKKSINENSNIEYALIADGENACKQLMPILDGLKSGQWKTRPRIKKGYNHINDDEYAEFDLEETGDEDFNNNFKTREIIKECMELIDKKQEREFDSIYKSRDSDEHPFKKNKKYLFKVMGVGVFFHLLVQKKNMEWVEMPYKRTIPDMIPYGCIEADQSVENIFKALKQGQKSTKPTNNEIQNSSSTLSIQDRNLRFPYDRLKNRKIRSIIETELIKLNKNRESISCDYRKLVDLWLPMINLMNKKGDAK